MCLLTNKFVISLEKSQTKCELIKLNTKFRHRMEQSNITVAFVLCYLFILSTSYLVFVSVEICESSENFTIENRRILNKQ